jgi:hypothetical protein
LDEQNVDEIALPPANGSGNSNLSRRSNKSSLSGQVSILENHNVHLNISQANLITNSIHQPPIIPLHKRITKKNFKVQKNH